MTVPEQSPRVLVISHDLVDRHMAGPGIRCWELAHALSRHHSTVLSVPGGTALEARGPVILPYSTSDNTSLAGLESAAREQADVVVSSQDALVQLPFLADLPVPLVVDGYIPDAVETLARNAATAPTERRFAYEHSWRAMRLVAQHADFLVCASERQRDLWIGVLAAYGRLHPAAFTADPDLRNLVDTVPFGCPATPPQPAAVLKGVWPGIGPRDRVLLWGGGVWNWFDPLTLLYAMPRILARHPETRLVLLGPDHPDAVHVREMETARQARQLSRELGLTGQSVFWGDWVDYDSRGAYLLEADVGVSLHRVGVEPRFAFRTRLLDAIWAGLPMVLTGGDILSEELVQRGVGLAVPAYDIDAVAGAVVALLDEPDARQARTPSFESLRQKYSWERVVEPLERFCRTPRLDATKADAMALTQADRTAESAALRVEIARMEQLVHGYESGRVMRLMAALHRVRRRVRP